MRKIPALLSVLGLATLSLAGCASVGAPDCTLSPTTDTAVQAQIDVNGEVGAAPIVAFDTPLYVDDAVIWETETGSGTRITSDQQLVALDVALYDGRTGNKLVTTAFDGDASRVFPMSEWMATFPHFDEQLRCAAEGSRVVIALPPDGVSEQTAGALGLGANDATVAVVDVTKAYLTRATGTTVFNDANGLPTVVRAPDGQPGIIVPDAPAPGEITVQTIIRGDGPVLTDADVARVNYTSVPFRVGGDVLETTWGSAPASVPVGDAQLPGFTEALTGQTVGSQVLLVVPADVAGSPGTAVVYVIDILGTDAPATTR